MSQAHLPPGFDDATLLQGEANLPVSKSQEEILLQQEDGMDINEDTPQAYHD